MQCGEGQSLSYTAVTLRQCLCVPSLQILFLSVHQHEVTEETHTAATCFTVHQLQYSFSYRIFFLFCHCSVTHTNKNQSELLLFHSRTNPDTKISCELEQKAFQFNTLFPKHTCHHKASENETHNHQGNNKDFNMKQHKRQSTAYRTMQAFSNEALNTRTGLFSLFVLILKQSHLLMCYLSKVSLATMFSAHTGQATATTTKNLLPTP